jgi:hypothetical protein
MFKFIRRRRCIIVVVLKKKFDCKTVKKASDVPCRPRVCAKLIFQKTDRNVQIHQEKTIYLSTTKSFNTDTEKLNTEKLNTIKKKCAAETYLEVEEKIKK